MSDIDTGDKVKHRPTGEEWIVAYVRGDRLAWCGWPEGEAELADCVLVERATAESRAVLLRDMATMSDRNDSRCRYARGLLQAGGRAVTHEDIFGDSGPITAVECAEWLDKKYARHGELEDEASAKWLRRLSAEIERLRPDAERLDFMERHRLAQDYYCWRDQPWEVFNEHKNWSGKTLRDAIDAAMKEGK